MTTITMTAIDFGVNTKHACHIRAFDKGTIKHMLSQVVKLVGEDSPGDSNGVVTIFSKDAIEDFGEPPDSLIIKRLPFLCHWFRTANNDRLISTQSRYIITISLANYHTQWLKIGKSFINISEIYFNPFSETQFIGYFLSFIVFRFSIRLILSKVTKTGFRLWKIARTIKLLRFLCFDFESLATICENISFSC